MSALKNCIATADQAWTHCTECDCRRYIKSGTKLLRQATNLSRISTICWCTDRPTEPQSWFEVLRNLLKQTGTQYLGAQSVKTVAKWCYICFILWQKLFTLITTKIYSITDYTHLFCDEKISARAKAFFAQEQRLVNYWWQTDEMTGV